MVFGFLTLLLSMVMQLEMKWDEIFWVHKVNLVGNKIL
jgi:hypothetical protein